MKKNIFDIANKNAMIHSIALVIGFTIIEKMITFFKGVIIPRLLGPDEYGVYTLANFALSVIVPLAIIGIPSAFLRYIPRYESRGQLSDFLRKSNRILLVTFVVVPVIIFLNARTVSIWIYNSDQYQEIIRLLCLLIPLMGGTQQLLATFDGLRMFKLRSWMNLIQMALLTGSAIFLVYFFNRNAQSVLYAQIFSMVLTLGFFGFFFYRALKRNPRQTEKIEENKFYQSLVKYSVWYTITPFVMTFLKYIDRLFLNRLLSLTEVGIYSVISNLCGLLLVFGMIINNVMSPNLSHLWEQQEREKSFLLINLSIKLNILFLLSVSLAISLFKNQIVLFLYGSQFSHGAYLIPYFLVFNLINLVWMIIYIYPNLIEKTYFHFMASVFGIFANIVLNYWLISKLGMSGAIIATLITFVLMIALLLILNIRHGLKIKPNTVFLILGSGILLLPIPLAVTLYGLFIGFSFFSRRLFNREEKQHILRIFEKQITRRFFKK